MTPAEQVHYETSRLVKECAPAVYANILDGHRQGRLNGRDAVAGVTIEGVLCSLEDSPRQPRNQVNAELYRLAQEHAPGFLALMRGMYRDGMIPGARAMVSLSINDIVCALPEPGIVSIIPFAGARKCEKCGRPLEEPPFIHECGEVTWTVREKFRPYAVPERMEVKGNAA